MNSMERLLTERDCLSTVLAFFAGLDAHTDADVVAQLSADCVWERNGEHLAGHAAVMSALANRPADRTTCHAVSNVRFEVLDDTHVIARFFLIVFEGVAATATHEAAFRLAAIRDCTDTLSLRGQRWLIDTKRSRLATSHP